MNSKYKKPQHAKWMTRGTPAIYSPPYVDGEYPTISFSGRIGGEPFLIGNPENKRWVVRLEDMDEAYQNKFKRTVHVMASIKYVTQATV